MDTEGKSTLSELRRQRNITQNELAQSLGVTKGAVGMWETGKRTPSLKKARELAKFFGVGLDQINLTSSEN